MELYPKDFQGTCESEHSGKLLVFENLTDKFKEENEKVVVVSNSTKMLDLFEKLFTKKNRKYFRLDGKTPTQDRQRLVDRFNSAHADVGKFLYQSIFRQQQAQFNSCQFFSPDKENEQFPSNTTITSHAVSTAQHILQCYAMFFYHVSVPF